MIAPLFFPLDASNCAVGDILLCQAVIGYMDRKLPAYIRINIDALDSLASGPQPELLQTVPCQISSTECNRISRKSHGQRLRPSHNGGNIQSDFSWRLPSAVLLRRAIKRIRIATGERRSLAEMRVGDAACAISSNKR